MGVLNGIDDGVRGVSRIVGRVGRSVESNVWLARNVCDYSSFRTMRQGAEAEQDAVVSLRRVAPLGVRKGTTDLATIWELFHRGEYFSENPIRPLSVLDLGANIGSFLAFIVARAGNILEHYVGVEADAGSYAALSAQVDRMAIEDRVTLFHAAAWDLNGRVRFADSGPEWGRAVVDGGGIDVEALRVDEILDRAGLDTCELVKMDIEGGEDRVLPTLSSWAHRVEVLTVELHGQPDSWLRSAVEADGFRFLPRGEYFRHHPAAVREDVVDKWVTPGGAALLR